MDKLVFYLKPWFDAHVHLRSRTSPWCDQAFELIVGSIAKQCRYAIVMPNAPKIDTVDKMVAYREMILSAARKVAPESDFEPLMTMYLTEKSTSEDIKRASEIAWFKGWKYYPQGVTTGSEGGVADIRSLERVLREIEQVGSRLLIHGETIRKDVGDLYTEEVFIKEDLELIRQMGEKIPICIEHCSTEFAVDAVLNDNNMFGSITPHHLFGTNDLTSNPHNRCKPVLQTEEQRQKVLQTIIHDRSGKFFAGTDTAPQLESEKLNKIPTPNGCFSAPTALQIYLAVFSKELETPTQVVKDTGLLVRQLDGFLYRNSAFFYNVPSNFKNISIEPHRDSKIILANELSLVTSGDEFRFYDPVRNENDRFVAFMANKPLSFSIQY